MKKLYSLNKSDFLALNSTVVHKEITNNTCRAIIRTLLASSEPMTGDEILKKAVDTGRWTTKQDESKYMTTFAYYVKKLKTHAGMKCVGEIADEGASVENFLEADEVE